MNLTFQSPEDPADFKREAAPLAAHGLSPETTSGDFGKRLRVLHDAVMQFPCYDAETIGEFEQAR
jgi:hypothetical protein